MAADRPDRGDHKNRIAANVPESKIVNKKIDKAYEKIYLAFEKYVDDFSDPIHLCGISLGAVLALHYTLDHADKVSSLVLIAPQYKMPKLLLRFQNIVFRIMPDSLISKDGIAKQDIIQLTNSMKFWILNKS